MEDEDRERGPVEEEVYRLIRTKNLADPKILDATVAGKNPPPPGEWEQILLRAHLVHMQAILRLAREIDDLRASL